MPKVSVNISYTRLWGMSRMPERDRALKDLHYRNRRFTSLGRSSTHGVEDNPVLEKKDAESAVLEKIEGGILINDPTEMQVSQEKLEQVPELPEKQTAGGGVACLTSTDDGRVKVYGDQSKRATDGAFPSAKRPRPMEVGVPENAPVEAPDEKLMYRSAILKSRFADTIIKATEKMLENNEKDPENVKQDMEEFKREGRKLKARFQAEAEAAEEALKKTEAVGSKLERELARAEARQRLREVEKAALLNPLWDTIPKKVLQEFGLET